MKHQVSNVCSLPGRADGRASKASLLLGQCVLLTRAPCRVVGKDPAMPRRRHFGGASAGWKEKQTPRSCLLVRNGACLQKPENIQRSMAGCACQLESTRLPLFLGMCHGVSCSLFTLAASLPMAAMYLALPTQFLACLMVISPLDG